jgi:Fe-S oxidoreductase
MASKIGALLNLRDRIPGIAGLSELFMGFSRKRTLPAWHGRPFRAAEANSAKTDADDAQVVLWADTFNTWFEPENARAALNVLRAAGYRVHVPEAQDGSRPLCCGRTFLATGLVDEAKAEARRMIDALKPYVERGLPIIGLEPSCLLTLRDEFQAMLPGEDADALAGRALLFEEFLAREHDAGRLALSLKPLDTPRALVHGHCHQKAFATISDLEKTMNLVPGLDVETIQSGCCGMAGAFGYDAINYDISMKMAEADLLPAVRDAANNGGDVQIIAGGTSCRHQIMDGASQQAIHVARLIERAMEGNEP